MKIKVIVATHKPYKMPSDLAYMPLQVGKAGKPSIGFVGDDTGENISDKNYNYCELTGLYWAWKNLTDADVIGLVHYRRHFMSQKIKCGDKWERILSEKEIEELLTDCDIILPQKRNYFIESNEQQYIHAHPRDDWEKMCDLVRADPKYAKRLDKICAAASGHKFNMLIMKREALNDYCSWLFPLLAEIEKTQLDKCRILGHLSERMLDIWLYANEDKYKFKEVSIKFMEKQNWILKGLNFLWRKFNVKT